MEEEKLAFEEEKKQFEEEIKQRNQEIYQMNEKLFFTDFNKTMVNTKYESDAVDKLIRLKETNVRRQADVQKLRIRL